MSLESRVQEKSNLIWSIADIIRDAYGEADYGKVILPMTVIRRFDCILSPIQEDIYKKIQSLGSAPEPVIDNQIQSTFKVKFYNKSKFTLKDLCGDETNIKKNFKEYLEGFSDNVKNIISKFEFEKEIDKLDNKDLLFKVVEAFTTNKADLHPSKVSNIEMGYIFEDIIRRFEEAHNDKAGQFYTPREVIRLMTKILVKGDTNDLTLQGKIVSIYDPACGTGGMLTVGEQTLKEINDNIKVYSYGQEINDMTFAICNADMLIKDSDKYRIECGNTLSDDRFKNETYDYIISNPPFGLKWETDKKAVEQEAEEGWTGRFGPGLPPVSDGQTLFLLTAIKKMKPRSQGGSRIAIVHNGSPLFSGDAGSGVNNIRKYIFESDLLECIIGMPNNIFYSTGIGTYVWILSNNKSKEREGKVQLIDASNIYTNMRKSLGNKRCEISKEQIEEIVNIYDKFEESEISKIFTNDYFGYKKIPLIHPLRDEENNLVLDNKGKKQKDKDFSDYENIPLNTDIEDYFEKEVKPFDSEAWFDKLKEKIGYEIPFTKIFYKYEHIKSTREIYEEIIELEKQLPDVIKELTYEN